MLLVVTPTDECTLYDDLCYCCSLAMIVPPKRLRYHPEYQALRPDIA